MMRKLILFSFIALVVGISCMNTPNKPNKIVGYVAGWKPTDFDSFDANKFTHINYAFANIVNGEVACEMAHDTTTIAKLHVLKKQNPNLKFLISVGGWVWSNHFSDVALTAESRAKFTKSAIEFIKFFKFDGVDLDWEYPGQRGEDNTFRAEDKQNFTLLLKDLREALDKESKAQNRKDNYLLTIATGADDNYIKHTELGECQKYLDFINIMTYDYYSGYASTTGHHSNFDVAKEMPNDNSGIKSVERHIKAGVPAHKLIMGLPFYGRRWKSVLSSENNGKYQKTNSTGQIVSYKEIVQLIKNTDYSQYWDENAKAPFLFNKKDSIFISYDDKKSIFIKYDYIKKMGLGGFMYWEYNNDNGNELLDAVNEVIKK
jgi:chitinase